MNAEAPRDYSKIGISLTYLIPYRPVSDISTIAQRGGNNNEMDSSRIGKCFVPYFHPVNTSSTSEPCS